MAKRIFVSFAIEDVNMRDMLKGQSLNTASPFEYTDYSVKEPWSSDWKSQCRTRIRGCDGMIALLSKNSLTASGQRWEIQCAVDESIPLVGMHVYKDDRSLPPEMAGRRVISWTWDGIAAFIDSL